MLTNIDDFLMTWCSFVMVVAGAGHPCARENTFNNSCLVGMIGSPDLPVWEVNAESHVSDKVVPVMAPFLTCCSPVPPSCLVLGPVVRLSAQTLALRRARQQL